MFLSNLYNNYIFKYHKPILTLLLSFLLFFGYFANKLNIDASSDTLILEGDKDLAYTQLVNKRYYSPDFLILAYTPKEGLLSKNTIETIENISAKLLQINNVDSVTSILNVPILMSPPRPITELVEFIPTLKSQNIDLDLVKKEFISSPLYSDNLVSRDFKTTSIIINLKEDKVGLKIRDERNLLREKNLQVSLNDTDLVKLNNLEKRYNYHKKII